jgi:hypothetical protein
MFSINLKRPLLALAVTAGLVAVAGPASAATTHGVDKDLNQPDMGIREQPTQLTAPHGLSIGSSEVFELNTIRSNGDGNDLNVAGPTGLKAGASEVLYETLSLKFDSNEWAEETFSIGSSEVFELNSFAGKDTQRTPLALIDKTMAEDSFTSVPEFDANANAFRSEVEDEVRA